MSENYQKTVVAEKHSDGCWRVTFKESNLKWTTMFVSDPDKDAAITKALELVEDPRGYTRA